MNEEPLFTINVFNKPEIAKKEDADAIRIYNLVLGRDDVHLSRDLCLNLRKYRFKEIVKARTEIETKLRAIMDKMASDIFLDSIDVVQVSNRKIHLTVKIIKNNEERKSVFMSIKKSENEKILVDLIGGNK